MPSLLRRTPIPVTFEGQSSAEGPLTLGQLNNLEWLTRPGQSVHSFLSWPIPLPAMGTAVTEVVDALGVLLARHEGLRTRFPTGEPRRQVVMGSGELVVEVYEVDDPDRLGDVDSLVAELLERLGDRQPDGATDLPVRVSLATRADLAVAGVIQYLRLVADHGTIQIIERELAELIREPSGRSLGPRPHQPLDQARAERTGHARRQQEESLRYWARHLAWIPQNLCAYPSSGTPSSGSVQLVSPAAALALPGLAARSRTSRSTVVLAAVCAVLSARTNHRRLGFPVIANNRLAGRLANYVGALAQSTLFAVEADASTFDTLARRVALGLMTATQHAQYDSFQRVKISKRITCDRGIDFDVTPLFNNVTTDKGYRKAGGTRSLDDIASARAASSLEWRWVPPAPTLVRFDLWQIDEAVRMRIATGDTSRLPRTEMEAVLSAVDSLLTTAARCDLGSEEMAEAIALDPVSRGPGWLLVDSCWVELEEVQRLVDEAAAPAAGRVFAVPDDRRLVAYLTANDSLRTPEDAHSRCMTTLPGRPAAMAPRHYVICPSAPDNPRDPEQWRRQPVLSQGSGRPARG